MTQQKFEVIIEQNVVTTFHIVADDAEVARAIALAGTRAPIETLKGSKYIAQVDVIPPRYRVSGDSEYSRYYSVLDNEHNPPEVVAEIKNYVHAELLCNALNEKEDAE